MQIDPTIGPVPANADMSDPVSALDRPIARASRLYSLPAVAMEVLELTKDSRVDIRALKECIENDPALTGKLLRVVNSSLFGLSCEVSDLNQALSLLGTKPLKLLVLGFSLPAGLFADVAEEMLGWYWQHTLTKAVAAREISETVFGVAGDEAFIAGLLQDLGILLLIQEVGEPYVKFLEKVAAGGKDLIALEIESMGFDHTALTAKLLAHWGLPDSLVEAIAWGTDPPESDAAPSPDQRLRQILYLAELVAQLLANERPGVLGKLLELGRKYHDLSEAQLEGLVGNLVDKVQQLANVLSLRLPKGLDYRDLLAQAHAQLAEVAAETAQDILRSHQGEAPQPAEESILGELQCLTKAVAEVSARPDRPPAAAQVPQASPAASAAAAENPLLARSIQVEADPGMLGCLGAAVASCRQSRCPLSLLLVQLDQVDELVMLRGLEGFNGLRRLLETTCANVDHPGAMCTPYGEVGFALILPDCERRAVIELGNQLIEQVRHLAPESGRGGRQAVGISVGVATLSLPPKNFPAEDLLSAADRCLYGSHASGGSVVKSIEI